MAPGPDKKDANVYFLPQKNSSELKFVLQFTVTSSTVTCEKATASKLAR